jgi:hypothetical protein
MQQEQPGTGFLVCRSKDGKLVAIGRWYAFDQEPS